MSKLVDIYSCISDKNPVQKIVDTAAQIFANPVSAGTAAIKLVACGGPPAKDKIFSEFTSKGFVGTDFIVFFRKNKMLSKIMNSQMPVLFEKNDDLQYRRILGKLMIDGTYVETCGVSEEYAPFEWDAIILVQTMIEALQATLLPEIKKLFPQNREAVISQIITGGITEQTVLQSYMAELKWTPKKYFCMCVINGIDRDILNEGLLGIQQIAKEICATSYLCIYQSYLVVIVNSDDPYSNEVNINGFKKLADIFHAVAGTSRNFTDLLEISRHLENVISMITWSRCCYPQKNWFEFENHYINGVIGNIKNARQLCHPGIQKLKSYDNIRGTDYTGTLLMYLECGCNMAAATERLYMHRNTLSHRILKIEEITGLDLKMGQDRFNAYLSLRIMAFEGHSEP